MAYPTNNELATFIGTTSDATIVQCVAAAIDFVVMWCNRQFVAYTATYEFYEKHIRCNGRELLFFRDCLSITTLTNGDGTVIGSDQYKKIYNPSFADPTNASFYGIKLLPTSGYSFVEGTVGYVSILGSWGYHATRTPPDAIFTAILHIGALLYRARSGGGGQIAQVQPSGVMVEGVSIPKFIIDMMRPFQRVYL